MHQVRVLELESSLERERLQLAALRKRHYHLAGASEGWDDAPEVRDRLLWHPLQASSSLSSLQQVALYPHILERLVCSMTEKETAPEMGPESADRTPLSAILLSHFSRFIYFLL